jgi:hypothetical protein
MDSKDVTSIEELHSLNTGDPSKILEVSTPYSEVKTLDEVLDDLHGCISRVNTMINSDLEGIQHFTTIDMDNLATLHADLMGGINYLTHLKLTLDAIGLHSKAD